MFLLHLHTCYCNKLKKSHFLACVQCLFFLESYLHHLIRVVNDNFYLLIIIIKKENKKKRSSMLRAWFSFGTGLTFGHLV